MQDMIDTLMTHLHLLPDIFAVQQLSREIHLWTQLVSQRRFNQILQWYEINDSSTLAILGGKPEAEPDPSKINKRKAVHKALTIQLSEGKGSFSAFAFPFQTLAHGVVRHMSSILQVSQDEI